MTELLTVSEVAARAGFKDDAIRREIKRGRLKASRLCGRWRISVDEYERWIARGATEDPDPAPAPSGEVVRCERPRAAGSFRELARRGPQ